MYSQRRNWAASVPISTCVCEGSIYSHDRYTYFPNQTTLIKKKIKCSSYIGKFRMEQLQSHIWLRAPPYIGKYLRISSYIRKPFLIYDFATAPLWISLYMKKYDFLFYQCRHTNRGIYESITETWMSELGLRPCSSFSGNICFEFSV